MWLSLKGAMFSVVFALLSISSANAQQSTSGELSKSQAASRASNAENGRVLKIEQTSTKYRVKVLKKSGRVVLVDVDKRSGKVNKSKDKD
ncbi:PepSY domain-containing protein [Alteromonas sp. BMJM2]|uniref:PepSY domain-containing protein n=1 Tax=Alteromonas sp. BMJM2 TaxID=2954241 RepID=UPI0022B2BA77|nr:PepSY domain-containing protein [Alteromonas sp. BMJM2]